MNSSFSFPAAPPPAPPVSNMNQMPASLTPEQQQQLLQQQYESQRQQFLFQQQQQQYQSQQGLEQLTPEQQFLLQQQQQQQQQILQQQYLSQQAQGQGSFQFPSTPLPSVAPANAQQQQQQQQQKEEEEKEVYDALFPAREMLRLQREAELKAKREEEDRLRQLEKMNKANAMPSVPSSSQFNAYSSGLQFPTVITQQPGAYSSQIPASAPPAAPTAASFFTPTPQTSGISSTTNASLSSLNGGVGGQNGMLGGGIGGAGGVGLSGAPGSASTASLLDHNVPDAYRNQAVSNGAPRNTDFFASLSRLQGDNSPYNAAGGAGPVSGSLLPSFNGGDQAAGANAEDDLNARIRRLSTMNLQSDAGNIYGSQNPNYYGSQAADMEPPTYSTPNLTYQRFVTQTTTIPGQPGSSDYPIYDVQEVGEGQEEEDDYDDEIYQTVDGERQQGLSSKEWQEQMDQDPNRVVSMEHLRYYSDRTQFRRKNTARQKAAKILIPVATTAGGVVAGAIGGAAIGAAAGGVGAPVGLVIGAVLGGTAGASVGVAATQTAPFRKQIVPVGTYRTSATRCAHCQSLFDLDPFSCQQCRRLFCRNCGVRNDGLMYCVQCSGPRYLPSSGPVEYRRIAY